MYFGYDQDKNRKEKRLEQGLCQRCGINPFTPGYKTCQECRNKATEARERYKNKYGKQYLYDKTEGIKKAKRPHYTLDEMCRMARERGISYGQLVVELEYKNGAMV